MAPTLWYTQRYNLNGILEDIALTTDLHAPGDISVHGGVSPGEPRTRALGSGAECSVDRATAAHLLQQISILAPRKILKKFQNLFFQNFIKILIKTN